jgi:hypothetical protein
MNKQYNINLALHIILTIFCIVIFYYLAIKTKPLPVSDFSYYWNSFDNLSQYYKGGFLFLPYLVPKLMNIEPYISALIVNSLCFLALSYSMWLGNKSKWQLLATILIIPIGVWFSGFIPIVNSDIPTITIFILGIRIFIKFLESRQTLLLVLSVIMITFSLSLRSQLLYITLLSIIFISLYSIFCKLKSKKISILLKYLFLILVASFTLATLGIQLLEYKSQEKDLLQYHKRATFYTGLLETPQQGVSCGGWNLNAVERTKQEMNKPLAKSLVSGFTKIPGEQLVNTILCKWENFLFEYNGSGLYWLEVHITNVWTEEKNLGELWGYYKHIEYFSVQILKLTFFSFILVSVYNYKKYQKTERSFFFITYSVILCFFLIHTILEIQPRYIIPPIMLGLFMPIYLNSGILKKIR